MPQERNGNTLDRCQELASWVAAGRQQPGERLELAAWLLKMEAAELELEIPPFLRGKLQDELRRLASRIEGSEGERGLIAQLAEERRELRRVEREQDRTPLPQPPPRGYTGSLEDAELHGEEVCCG